MAAFNHKLHNVRKKLANDKKPEFVKRLENDEHPNVLLNNGDIATHILSQVDNYAIPLVQPIDYNNTGLGYQVIQDGFDAARRAFENNDALRFNSDADTERYTEMYKNYYPNYFSNADFGSGYVGSALSPIQIQPITVTPNGNNANWYDGGGLFVRGRNRSFSKANPELRRLRKEAAKERIEEQYDNWMKYDNYLINDTDASRQYRIDPILGTPSHDVEPSDWANNMYDRYMSGEFSLDAPRYGKGDRKYKRALNKEIRDADWSRAAEMLEDKVNIFANDVANRTGYEGLGKFMMAAALSPALFAAPGILSGLGSSIVEGAGAAYNGIASLAGTNLLKNLAISALAGETINQIPRIWSGKTYTDNMKNIMFSDKFNKEHPVISDVAASAFNPGYYFNLGSNGLRYSGPIGNDIINLLSKSEANIGNFLKNKSLYKNMPMRIDDVLSSTQKSLAGSAPSRQIELITKSQNITPENAASVTSEQWTAAQDAAIARGDMAEAQRLRDLHFVIKSNTSLLDNNGYPLHMYHGSPSKNITSFKHVKPKSGGRHTGTEGYYFSPDISYADRYRAKHLIYDRNIEDGKTYDVYLNTKRTAIFPDDFPETFKISSFENMNYPEREYLEKNGFDSTKLGDWTKNINKHKREIVVLNPNQIKLADAVTYDDNGVRIPLGERDNFDINDIRYDLFNDKLKILKIAIKNAIKGSRFYSGKDAYDVIETFLPGDTSHNRVPKTWETDVIDFVENDVNPRIKRMLEENSREYVKEKIPYVTLVKPKEEVDWKGFASRTDDDVKLSSENPYSDDAVYIHEMAHRGQFDRGNISNNDYSNYSGQIPYYLNSRPDAYKERLKYYGTGYTNKAEQYLNDAYTFTDDFLKLHKYTNPIDEKGAINREIRYNISKHYTQSRPVGEKNLLSGDKLDSIIDKMSDDELLDFFEFNTYSNNFMENMLENEKRGIPLHDQLLKVREALKYVPAVIPFAIPIKTNNKDKK